MVSSDWMPSYMKVTLPVLEIFKMNGYFPDNPHTLLVAGVPGQHIFPIIGDQAIQEA